MRMRGLGTALIVFATRACELVGSERAPLTLTEPSPDAGHPGMTPIGGMPADAGASTITAGSPACWARQLPPEVKPILPQSTVTDACQVGSTTTQWSYPQDPPGIETDGRPDIVGRWVACGSAGFSDLRHAG